MIDLLARRREMMGGGVQPTPPIPPEYTEVEYVSMSGVDCAKTDFVPTADCKVEVAYQGAASNSSKAGSLFGSRSGYNSKCFYYKIGLSSGSAANMTHECGYNVINSVTAPNIAGDKNVYCIDNGTFYCNDDVIGSYTATFTPEYPIFIGTYNNAGNKSTQACGSGNYFHCKCWDGNGELVRDYRPVVRVADNAKGFFDVINQTFIPIE